ncbi:Pinin SDK memA domain-containing protein [Citrus sinensis]|uniref:Pinin SDK memA domain-containing protein n=1 Tax=Citrus sinensis TaxID=2711 RepID=A0ACB8KCA8_CITSI|nr:Pinin SDK memA domain-containing protein [Citrus sinensis]
MGSTAVEKSAEQLQREIDELHRQQREITERLKDPRGLRRGALSGPGPRNFPATGARQRGFARPADRTDVEEQPPAKRRLLSAVVKVESGILTSVVLNNVCFVMKLEDGEIDGHAGSVKDTGIEGADSANQSDKKPSSLQQSGWPRRDGHQKAANMDNAAPVVEHIPRVLPKNEDPSLVNRNKRMLGQLLGTLEAEQRAREESERLRQQEREQIAEKRKRDLILRARVAAKAEEKKLELLFLRWSEHHKKLSNFIRTKTEPPIYYLPTKPLEEDTTLLEQHLTYTFINAQKQEFLEWKAATREKLSEYQKQIEEQYVANVEKEMERWQNARKARKANNDMLNLQETMDKELDTHRLEHGPKPRKIPGGSNNEDEDDVEDINVGEDDMMDDVLVVDDSRRVDETAKLEAGNSSPPPEIIESGN